MEKAEGMKPLLSYYGGKQRIASRILAEIEQIPHTVYVEPFAGGATLLFAKPVRIVGNDHHYREVINDTNNLITTFYQVAREQPDELQRWIELTPYSQADHKLAIEVCKNPKEYDSIKVAWAMFVNLNQSFTNRLNAGWRASVVGENEAATWHNRKTRLPEQLERLSKVYVSSEDAIRCIQRWDSPQTVFYCDPPYPGTHQGHYSGYTVEDWQRLCETLDNCQGSYVLSNYSQEVTPQSSQKIVDIAATMSAAKTKGRDRTKAAERPNNKRTEKLWICDRSSAIRDDLKVVLRMTRQPSLFKELA